MCSNFCASLAVIKVTTACYNNIARRLLRHQSRDSASQMFVTNNLDQVKVILRKPIYNLNDCVENSDNEILKNICDNFYISSCGAITKYWQKSLYMLY